MSPGATFERVYQELKRMLSEGELPPGAPIEPALIGKRIASSITPIRDALHRLTGERLVEAPNHNGFRVPSPTEAALRDLYQWNGRLLGLAVKSMRSGVDRSRLATTAPPHYVAAAAAELFLRIARETGSSEHVDAIVRANDRLAPYRRVEVEVLDELPSELEDLAAAVGSPTELAKGLAAYHRRRIRAVPDILTHER
ncbi:GntR family transcriptional regulator [Sphingomonas psychrotolerans]|uniref:GntR family transcriptional regulator n=1 Tax=Sphingomonas psychrotolerans TaxID=1327635 RepID=A0ABU3N7T0_9SPHN|nr:GntR family transcriptional regulator [Sphingomonas psychrotolerans]MDT8760549.1 GntR family transcriptional regulator [Sphingomonas psychrotolerans]